MKRIALIAAALALLAGPASAHTLGAAHDHFLEGFAHPFGGLDHLLAMLGVGIWAFQSGGRVWLLPLAFMAAMVLGGIAGFAGLELPGVEFGIAGSVLLLGFLIALAPRLPAAIAAGLVGLFALCHGFAHGAEAPQAASPALYALGFVLATGIIHLAGIGLASAIHRLTNDKFLRAAGLIIGAVGVALFAS